MNSQPRREPWLVAANSPARRARALRRAAALRRSSACAMLLLLLMSTIASARKRDPLTEAEADQVREAALEPQKRLKLYIQFTGARLDSIDQMRKDAKQAAGRGKNIHDLLDDFSALLDEINDNLDQYQGRPLTKDERKDFHKGLKEVIEACQKWDTRLKALQTAGENDPETLRESQDYRFALDDAQDALKNSAEVAHEYADKNASYDQENEKPGKRGKN